MLNRRGFFVCFVIPSLVAIIVTVKGSALPSEIIPPEYDKEVTPQDALAAMTNLRLQNLLNRLDPNLRGELGSWILTIQGQESFVVTDDQADRMRIMIEVADIGDVSEEQLFRMLQANFESALDARYAVAQGKVWSVFIHPLSPLSEMELASGIAQTYNAALTYGDSYSSGLFQFNGGDNRNEIFDEIIDRSTLL